VLATSTKRVIPLGTYTESPCLGSVSPPQVSWFDHLSIYKNDLEITKTGLPSEVITKEFDEGIVLLIPVVHTI